MVIQLGSTHVPRSTGMLFEMEQEPRTLATRTMSTWRRKATQLLPEQRRCIQMARSPLALWQQMYAFAVDGCRSGTVDDDLLQRLFQVACDSRSSASAKVRAAVQSEFYHRLFEDEVARLHFRRHLRETEFLELEAELARGATSLPWRELRTSFYEARADLDSGTTLGAARRLKDEILDAATPEAAEQVREAWAIVLPLLEVHEDVVGLEIFMDNLSELTAPIRGDLESRLRETLEGIRRRKSAPDHEDHRRNA